MPLFFRRRVVVGVMIFSVTVAEGIVPIAPSYMPIGKVVKALYNTVAALEELILVFLVRL